MKRSISLGILSFALATIPATAATLTSGHVDFIGIGYDGTDLEPHSHAEAGAVVNGVPLAVDTEFEPGELTVQTFLTTTRASGSAWDSIGVLAGQTFWYLPESEIVGHPYVGIGAEELIPTEWTGPITITLTAAAGSGISAGGVFSLWQTDAGVPTFFMSTLDGISAADVYALDLSIEDHAHFGWGFTEQGIYDLTFEIAGIHATDGAKTATATYRFSVIPEPSSVLLGAIGALGLLRRRR